MVASNKDFVQCYDQVMEVGNQVDGNKILKIIEDFFQVYMDEDLKPRLMDKQGVELTQNLATIWDNLVIYAISFDRLFTYINKTFL